VLYHGEKHILHLEFESGIDAKLRSRILVYNAILFHTHQKPVITIVIYPFGGQKMADGSRKMAESPLVITESGGQEIHRFCFQTLSLLDLDATMYLEQHLTCMYPLIPTMHGANAQLIDQAIQELSALYPDDQGMLGEQLVCSIN
jgi:hypothetical protein